MAPGPGLELEWLEGRFAVWRLSPGAGERVREGGDPADGLLSVTRTGSEVSVVGREAQAPAGARVSPGWAALRVKGELDHSLTGVLAALAVPLAEAGVPIFALSTFDTDYVLVPADLGEEAAVALREAGHGIG